MTQIKTLQIKMLPLDYQRLSDIKKKWKVKNWYEFTLEVIKKEENK